MGAFTQNKTESPESWGKWVVLRVDPEATAQPTDEAIGINVVLWLLNHQPSTTMLPSFFRPEERKHILSYLDEWEGLKGAPKTEDEEGDLVSSKDLLIDRIIQDLFSKFPERDMSVSPEDPLVWVQADRDRLHGVCLCWGHMNSEC